MKTVNQINEALMDARENKFNIEQTLVMLKNEMTVLGAQLSDTVAENMMNRINDLEQQYSKACLLVAYYENELGK